MYKNNFVVAIKSDGKVLREIDDRVYLPFGSSYSIFMKNLDSRRASVAVDIDGRDVLDSNRLIINSHNDLELEGFMSENRAEYGFKFIERTKAIESYRGIKAEDGIIRVEVKFEKHTFRYYSPSDIDPFYWYTQYTYNNDREGEVSYAVINDNYPEFSTRCSSEDIGITVKGDDISQNFIPTSFGSYDNDVTVICLRLFGIREDPIFVKTKLVCSSCGKSHSSNNKYCSECGTRLL
jgi:hypothetical protein